LLTIDEAVALQRFSRAFDAVDVSTTAIEVEDVNVDLMAHAIDHDEVPVSRPYGRLAAIPCGVRHDHQVIRSSRSTVTATSSTSTVKEQVWVRAVEAHRRVRTSADGSPPLTIVVKRCDSDPIITENDVFR